MCETYREVRAECDAVTRCYARLGGHCDPVPDATTQSETSDDDDDESNPAAVVGNKRSRTSNNSSSAATTPTATPPAAELQWLSKEFGCILEVPG